MINTSKDNYALEYSKRWENDDLYRSTYLPFKDCIRKMEIRFIDSIVPIIYKYLSTKEKITVFDVGCGNGVLSLYLLRSIGIPLALYSGIDLNKAAITDHPFFNYSFRERRISLENINNLNLSKKYDIILLLNSIYGVTEKSVKMLINSLNKIGVLVVLVNSKDGIFGKVNNIGKGFYWTAESFEMFLLNNNYYFKKKRLSYTFPNIKNGFINILSNYFNVSPSMIIKLVGNVLVEEIEDLFLIKNHNAKIV